MDKSMKRFVLIGPESTGKTTLGKQLAEELNTVLVPEYLREFYAKNGIEEYQMKYVAEQQLKSEYTEGEYEFILLDTNIVTLKIYHEYYFMYTPSWFQELYDSDLYEHYFLMDTSVPWVFDEQRDSPEVREELFELFQQELIALNVDFTIITGNYEERFYQVKNLIESLR